MKHLNILLNQIGYGNRYVIYYIAPPDSIASISFKDNLGLPNKAPSFNDVKSTLLLLEGFEFGGFKLDFFTAGDDASLSLVVICFILILLPKNLIDG